MHQVAGAAESRMLRASVVLEHLQDVQYSNYGDMSRVQRLPADADLCSDIPRIDLTARTLAPVARYPLLLRR